MRNSCIKLLIKVLILVMIALPLQSMAKTLNISGMSTVPCAAMGNMLIKQDSMDMSDPCQMKMASAQSCIHCDYSVTGIFSLIEQNISIVTNLPPRSHRVIQVTTNVSPPPVRPPIKISIS